MALTKVSGDFIQDGSITQGHLHASHGITTSDIGEGSNLYFTTARVNTAVGNLSTSDLSEGTNLYYTDARVASYLTTNNYVTSSSTHTFTNKSGNISQWTNDSGYITGYTETDTLATVTARGASTSTAVALSSTDNHYNGHFYWDAYNADGAHYPHFLDGSNANGVDINWRLYTGNTISVNHLWNVTKTEFRNQLHTTVDARAPIYYDRNDTNYYLNPASDSRINNINVDGGAAYPLQTSSSQRYMVQVRHTGNSTNANYGWWWFMDTNFNMGFHADGAADIMTLTRSGSLSSTGDMRAPIFYDTQNTGYYVDPVSTSNLAGLNVGGASVWTSGNDGSGSGLDADLLDGQHASAFASSSHTHAASDITSGNLAAARNTANLVNIGSSSDASGIYFRGTNEIISGEGWCTAQYAFNENDGFLFLNRNSSNTAFPTFHIGGWNNAGYAGYSNADGLLTLTRSDGSKSTGSTYAGTGLSNTSYYTNIIKTTAKTVFRDAQSSHEFTGNVQVGTSTAHKLVIAGNGNYMNINYDQIWNAGGNLHLQYSSSGNIDMNAGGGYAFSRTSLRAPVFYDYNNTNYYVDPQSNTRLSGFVKIGNSSTYNSDDGSWGARLQVVSTVHARIDVGQDANSMRSTWYAHTGHSGPMFGTSTGHPLRLMYNGSEVGYWNGTQLYHNSSVRAPIFYDSNNTSFYVDPSNAGTNISINTAGIIRGNYFVGTNYAADGYTVYKGYDNWNHFISIRGHARPGYSKAQSAIAGGHQTSFVEYAENNSTTGWFFIGSAGSTYEEIAKITKDFAQFTQLRAPIFYDSNNTNYYTDPASTSVLNALTVGGNTVYGFSGSWNGSNFPGSRWGGYTVNGGEIVFQRDNPSNGKMSVMVDGSFYAGENGGFWSIYSGNNYNNRVGIYGDSSGNLNIGTSTTENILRTNYGYIQMGPMNSSHAHIYTDRSNFYFNKQIQLLGGSLINQNDIRSGEFYEKTNTNYFIDPSLNSTIYNLQLGRSGNTPKFDMLFNDHSSGAGWDTRIFIGRSDDLPNGSSFPTSTAAGGYGIQFQANSDGVFYGMKQYSSGNYRPYINWGDDGSDSPMEIAFNGSTKFTLSYQGVNYASNSHRAPIFYDSGNTTYYTRPASSSNMYSIYTASFIQVGASGYSNLWLGGQSGNYFRFHTNNSDTYFDANVGNVYWRQGSSTRFYFYMTTANMTINGTLTQNSDIRVKENVVEIPNAIDKIQAMRGVYYNRTDLNTDVTKVGVIAQEVEAVLPEVILEAPDTELKSVAYAELTAVLINGIKEQQTIIDDLKARIEILENQ